MCTSSTEMGTVVLFFALGLRTSFATIVLLYALTLLSRLLESDKNALL